MTSFHSRKTQTGRCLDMLCLVLYFLTNSCIFCSFDIYVPANLCNHALSVVCRCWWRCDHCSLLPVIALKIKILHLVHHTHMHIQQSRLIGMENVQKNSCELFKHVHYQNLFNITFLATAESCAQSKCAN